MNKNIKEIENYIELMTGLQREDVEENIITFSEKELKEKSKNKSEKEKRINALTVVKEVKINFEKIIITLYYSVEDEFRVPGSLVDYIIKPRG